MKPPPLIKPIEKEIDHFCLTVDKNVRKLVLADAEQESERFRRRMHLHLCLIALAAGATLLSIMSLVDATSAICLTLGFNSVQEFIDYMGRF